MNHAKDKMLQMAGSTLAEPAFSIITPTYNSGSKLDRTVKSVLSQSLGDFEYLLMDGFSQDGTREWIAGIKDPRVKAFSEPDKGTYDAMNKGVQQARGKYLVFLCSGDELLPGILQEMIPHLPKEGLAMIYGNVLWNGMIYSGKFSKLDLCDHNICHQAIFYGRRLFQILGGYDLKYKTLADWAFNLKCFGNSQIQIRHVSINVALYEGGGISEGGDPIFNADRKSLILRHLGLITSLRFKWANHTKRMLAKRQTRKLSLKKPVPQNMHLPSQ
jgi:hypothetical protein